MSMLKRIQITKKRVHTVTSVVPHQCTEKARHHHQSNPKSEKKRVSIIESKPRLLLRAHFRFFLSLFQLSLDVCFPRLCFFMLSNGTHTHAHTEEHYRIKEESKEVCSFSSQLMAVFFSLSSGLQLLYVLCLAFFSFLQREVKNQRERNTGKREGKGGDYTIRGR